MRTFAAGTVARDAVLDSVDMAAGGPSSAQYHSIFHLQGRRYSCVTKQESHAPSQVHDNQTRLHDVFVIVDR